MDLLAEGAHRNNMTVNDAIVPSVFGQIRTGGDHWNWYGGQIRCCCVLAINRMCIYNNNNNVLSIFIIKLGMATNSAFGIRRFGPTGIRIFDTVVIIMAMCVTLVLILGARFVKKVGSKITNNWLKERELTTQLGLARSVCPKMIRLTVYTFIEGTKDPSPLYTLNIPEVAREQIRARTPRVKDDGTQAS